MEATVAKLSYYPEICLDEFEKNCETPQTDYAVFHTILSLST